MQSGPTQERPLYPPCPSLIYLLSSPGSHWSQGGTWPRWHPWSQGKGLLGTQHGQWRARVWEGLRQRGAGTQETPASEPLPLLLQGQPGLPGPPGLPVSITCRGFNDPVWIGGGGEI